MKRLQHDVAFSCARALLDIIAPALRPEEHKEVFECFYQAVSAAIQAYETAVQNEGRRLFPLRPSGN